jgi:hypothetical protein
MSRFSRKAGDEVPSRHSDAAQRRTRPEDVRPYSPKRIEALYSKGKTLPLGKGGETHEHQPPQFAEDKRDEKRGKYTNDVARGSYLVGAGGDGRPPHFDSGKYDPNSKPPKPASGLRASGRDIAASPFSAAHRTYSED